MNDVVGALGGPVPAATGQTDQNEDTVTRSDTVGTIPAPTKASALPAWGIAMGLGKQLATGLLEKNPEWAESVEEEELTYVMQSLMNQVTKSMGESLDYLKELDDDEDKCGFTQIYQQ